MKQKGMFPTEVKEKNPTATGIARRQFLSKLGGAAAIAAVAASCQKSISSTTPSSVSSGKSNSVVFGNNDIAILNYAYLLEQLEAAYYMQVTMNFYSGATDSEKALIRDLMGHEIAHREFFKNALAGDAIPEIEFDFSTVDFSSRDSVLATAKSFEDTGVGAYNGAGHLFVNPDYLLVAGKIVSVEARHAAYIRDLLVPGSFAGPDVVDSNGLDLAYTPKVVIGIVSPYIVTDISAFPFK